MWPLSVFRFARHRWKKTLQFGRTPEIMIFVLSHCGYMPKISDQPLSLAREIERTEMRSVTYKSVCVPQPLRSIIFDVKRSCPSRIPGFGVRVRVSPYFEYKEIYLTAGW